MHASTRSPYRAPAPVFEAPPPLKCRHEGRELTLGIPSWFIVLGGALLGSAPLGVLVMWLTNELGPFAVLVFLIAFISLFGTGHEERMAAPRLFMWVREGTLVIWQDGLTRRLPLPSIRLWEEKNVLVLDAEGWVRIDTRTLSMAHASAVRTFLAEITSQES